MKLNLDLTLPDDGECPALLISSGIIDLGAFCVELWSFYCSKRILVPMSYISLWDHIHYEKSKNWSGKCLNTNSEKYNVIFRKSKAPLM